MTTEPADVDPPCIDPSVAEPRPSRGARIARQPAGENASGLYSLVTAARRLGALHPRAGARQLLERLSRNDLARIRERLPRIGLREQDIRALADAAGLYVWRPHPQQFVHFREPGWTWMALVLVRLAPHDPERASRAAKHFVLVVDYLPDTGALVVADPHPSNPPLYAVSESCFEAAWRAAKPKGPPLAVAFYRP